MRRLDGAWKVAVLTAPAGSGKTTLAAQIADRRDALWCRVRTEDRDPTHLFGSLLGAAARMRRRTGSRTRRLFESHRDMERDGGLLIASFLDELETGVGKSGRLVVLDDLHVLADAREALGWLRRLIEESGPRLRFVLTCRGEPPLPVTRWALDHTIVILRGADLDFTLAEQEALLRGVLRLRLDPTARSALRASVGGWAAGLVLAARHWTVTGRAPERAQGEPGTARAFAFMAEEVFAPLPARLQRALCRAAMLEELDRDAVRLVLGPADAEYFFRETARRDLFLQSREGDPAASFHPLFREFLRNRAPTAPDPGRARRLRRLSSHWAQRGEPGLAVRALAEAGDLRQAARVFDRVARGDPEVGKAALRPVADQLASAPEGPTSPLVLLHAAMHSRDAGRIDEALRRALEAADGFVRHRAFRMAAAAYRLEVQLAILTGRWRGALRHGEVLLGALPARPRVARAEVLIQLGYLALHAGDPRRAQEMLAAAVPMLRGRGLVVQRAEAALRRGVVVFTEGRWDVYLDYARQALGVYRRTGHVARAQTLLVNMAEACTYLGEEATALAYLDEVRTLVPRSGTPSNVVLAAIGRARALSERGSLSDAETAFKDAREELGKRSLPMMALQLEVWHGILERRRGRLPAAERILTRAVDGFLSLESPSWLTLARMERALVRGLRGHRDEALRDLAAAAHVSRRLGDRKELARNQLFEARVRQTGGTSFAAPLARALRALERDSYLVLLRKEVDVAAPLLAGAPSTPAIERARANLPEAARNGQAKGRSPTRARAQAGRAATRTTSGRIPEVTVRLLGGFEVRVDGDPVSFARRAAEHLVAYLALRRGQPVRREALAELLWPGAAPEASRNRFDVALNTARQALEPNTPARGPFRRLHTEGGLCRLASERLALDVEQFERLARATQPWLERQSRTPWVPLARVARGDARRAAAALEIALAAYPGDLLPELADAPWVVRERERLREHCHRLQLAHGHLALALGRVEPAADAARQVLASDPLHEEAERLLLRALGALGERAAVVRSYGEFAARLARELETSPSPETAALAEELSGQRTRPAFATEAGDRG
ncbi:MAG TPA: BTAD domain-containing putative transcriptional regulator [Candidatus Limnocylindria bacterium]|nr:BTAD domain-containing putative transcriptional regulator [Candidatus Limnocylindria bacterium]